MATVKVEERSGFTPAENLAAAYRKFCKKVEDEGILDEYRERMFYQKPSAKKHKQKRYIKRKMQIYKARNEKKNNGR